MNLDNLDRLIRHLENDVDDEHFTMSSWGKWRADYGTVACIAGYCVILKNVERFRDFCRASTEGEHIHFYNHYLYKFYDHYLYKTGKGGNISSEAGDWLGLSLNQSICLFNGIATSPWVLPLTDITREHALCTLKVLRETGEVDWDNSQKRWAEIAI